MQARLSCAVSLLLSSTALVVGCSSEGHASRTSETAAQSAAPKTNPDAELLVDFKKRIDDYMALHNKLEKEAPPLKETKDPAKINASQDVLAMKLREARKDARQGDIFTPEIRQLFRRLMYPEVKGPEGRETKAAIAEESHELKTVTLKVNAKYPDTAPLMTVPPNILAALPKLPEDLEYRFVNRNMILLDTHANLIVDFVPNAIQ
jgi:uncharacterized protein YicC (UPF0701 family)